MKLKLSILGMVFIAVLLTIMPAHGQTALTFDVWRDGNTNTYHAVSQTTSSIYTGTLKFVVESAVSELATSGGGNIIFAAGDFDLGSTFFKFYDPTDITFAGQGIDVTVLRNWSSASADTEPFNCSNCDRITIRDMTISAGGPTRSTSDAIDLDDGDGNLIERVKITASRGRAIVFDGKGKNGGHADGNTVRDCIITGSIPYDGIQMLASNNNHIQGCTITGVGRYGIYAVKASSQADQPNKPSNDNVIIGNLVQNATNHGIAVSSSHRNKISGNTSLNNGSMGIYISASTSFSCNDNIVEYNTAAGNPNYGLYIGSSDCHRTVVRVNDFSGNGRDAIRDLGTNTIYITSGATPTPTATATGTPISTATNTPTSTPASNTTLTLNPVGDAYVNESSVNSNYGNSTTLRTDASPIIRSYLRFTVPAISGNVTSAKLRVYANSGSSVGYTVHSTNGSWTESTITYANAPAFGGSLGSSGAITSNTWTEVDLTGYVTSGGGYNLVMTSSSNTAISFASRETANPPQLVVVVQDGGALPTNTPTPSNTPTATDVPSNITLVPVADAYVYSANPNTNYGSSSQLRVDGSPDTLSYLRFDLQGVSGTVVQATLRVYANSSSSTGYRAHGTTNVWTESTLTYANAPAIGSFVGTSGTFYGGTWTSVDVTSLFTGGGLVSVALTTTNSTAISLSSREGAIPPELVLHLGAGSSLEGETAVSETKVPFIMPTPLPTVTLAPSPTATLIGATATPSEPNLKIVESDDPRVMRTGTWTSHDTSLASGESYVFSNGDLTDTLTVVFQGTRAAVSYVKHPALGSFAIEIDGIQLQQVITTSPDTQFGTYTVVSNLSEGQHTLRVYPISGTIAIDAFAVEVPLTITSTATPVVTEADPTDTPPTETPVVIEAEPTDTPPTETPVVTEAEPTDTPPTETPVVTEAEPTDTPLPVTLPFIETFDSGLGWSADTGWQLQTGTAQNGAAWYASSMLRGTVSRLSGNHWIDLRGALNPQLSFWQRSVLSSADTFMVEVSGDGGMSWDVLSLSTNLVSDWTETTIDLSSYQGMIVRLRFTLNTTDALPQNARTEGVVIDDLVVRDLPQLPTVEPTSTSIPMEPPTNTPLPTEPPTLTPTDIPTSTPLPDTEPTSVPTVADEPDALEPEGSD